MQNEQKPKPTTANVQAVNLSARRNARRYALQAMYNWLITDAAIIDIEKEFLQYHIHKPHDQAYFKELIHAIPQQQALLDAEILPFLDRELQEVDPIEISALRIAVYEFLKRPDIPYRVIINEALELTKKYGSIEGYKFINSVLDRIAKKLRQVEINSPRESE